MTKSHFRPKLLLAPSGKSFSAKTAVSPFWRSTVEYAFYQNKNYSCFTYNRNENKTILVFNVNERTMKL